MPNWARLRGKRGVAMIGRRSYRWVCDKPVDVERHCTAPVYTEREASIYTIREGTGRVTLYNT